MLQEAGEGGPGGPGGRGDVAVCHPSFVSLAYSAMALACYAWRLSGQVQRVCNEIGLLIRVLR